jgi:K+-transporting ATPase c subunit
LRRAVVARALLAVGMDERKRSGESASLASALALARNEVSYFQGRVEQAKQDKNTEAAVNLGISTKRLLSFIEEAEKLQP